MDLLNQVLPRRGIAVQQLGKALHLGFRQFAAQMAFDQFFPVVVVAHDAPRRLDSMQVRTCFLRRNSVLRTASRVIPTHSLICW